MWHHGEIMRARERLFPSLRINADRIIAGLYQGSAPPLGDALRRAGFAVLILAAYEHQPRAEFFFPGVFVHRAPLDDHTAELSSTEWRIALQAAAVAAQAIMKGMPVLVTCQMGLNRSGLISALVTQLLTGCPAEEAIARVRRRRTGALRNASFVRELMRGPSVVSAI